MKVLIFHGYLLRGTGSNVYNANVAQALSRLGHDVHLFCQDLQAEELPWIDAIGGWSDGRLSVEQATGNSPGEGSITAYRPDIGGLLPVYVADTYVGFTAKTFEEMTEAEVEAYIAANVAAVADVAARADGIDAALANHLVMGPTILARAVAAESLASFAAKVHGSALSYTVIPNPQRFVPYAREGMEAARTVLVGSHHTGASLWETVDLPGLEEKTRLGPPGVDIEAFSPLPEGSTPRSELEDLAERMTGAESEGGLGRDPEAAAAGIRAYAAGDGPRVVFVGKLIVSKGCDLLLAAWPLIVRENPAARLLMVGFGEYHEGLLRLWTALETGELDDVREIARLGWALEGGEERPLKYLSAFLGDLPDGYEEAARVAAGSVDFSGRLEYGEVAHVARSSDAMVVPSTFPEAFGMVAAEAASAGALPVCAGHSGLAEVSGALAGELPPGIGELTTFDLGPGAVAAIADRVNRWLALPEPERAAARADLVEAVRERWSWEGVGRTVVKASDGDLAGLPRVPGHEI